MKISFSDLRRAEQNIRRIVLLVLLYLLLPVQALLPIDDPDIWWRFRMGEWIVTHRWFPYVDAFSAYDVGQPWIEYSWGFAVLVFCMHKYFGLVGIVYLIVGMALLITLTVHRLIRRARLPFILEIVLTAIALAPMKSLMTPRPWLFTICFFAVEVLIIEKARRSGRVRLLWWLVPLFVVWANTHIQFIYGLVAVFFIVFEVPVINVLKTFGVDVEEPKLPFGQMLFIAGACTLATLVSPYHVLLYRQIFDYVGGQTGIFQNIRELHPMFFRSPGDWSVLLLLVVSAYCLGWRRKVLIFETLLLCAGAFAAFRARRDAWFLVIAALATLGTAIHRGQGGTQRFQGKMPIVLTAVSLAIVIFVFSQVRQINERHLATVVERSFPSEAVQFVREHRLRGPLFNHFDWGGFLIWSLPEIPVVMDGRVNLYGDARFEQSLSTWAGRSGWDKNPDLMKANLIIAPRGRPLTDLLRASSHYKVEYEDEVAVVFSSAKSLD